MNELFSSLAVHGRREELGLWGELAYIARSENVPQHVDAWQVVGGDRRFDFDYVDFVVDVKTTLSTRATHEFTLDQIRINGTDSRRRVAAVCHAIESETGASVLDLAERICGSCSDQVDLVARVNSQIFTRLGAGFDFDLVLRLDFRDPTKEFRFFDLTSALIPTHAIPEPVIAATIMVDTGVLPEIASAESAAFQ